MSQATLGIAPYRNSSLFSGYYLDERINDLEEWECDEDAREAFEALQELWALEGELVAGYKEDELLDSWIDEVLDILGFGTQSETTVPGGEGFNDRLLFESDSVRREAAKQAMDGKTEAMYGKAAAILEAKQWDADFTKQFDERRSYRDASHQIKYYLEHTPERLQWGILTDGKKWRLYGTKDYATEIYYEVDLPELLEAGELEQFKYFYAFFRPAAFREISGTTFLDTVWNESETAAQELGEDLQDNVFTALRVLGEGFIHSNDLDIDPDDEAAREELKEQSLVLLYRLMFVLYAESRGLIHPDDPKAQAEYDENFSLDQIRLEIHEAVTSGDTYDDWSGYSTQIWGQLEDLFGLVDEGEKDLGIPPYNGGLFDTEEHAFLAEHEVADRYIAEVIHRLGTTEGEDGEAVLADYADLDTRHLGSIYEGLLEHEFRIASEPYAAVAEDGGQVWKPGTDVSVAEAVETVEEGELYVVNDDGERKATGAYYTPDYVVSYIVEETVDPLLDDIREDLEADGLEPSDQGYFGRFYGQVQDLNILDPAMGSAHFLTSATAYLTEQVMEVVREQEEQGRDEQEIRRTIAKECIYGVDVNGMAVEPGKLSMWLETLAADKPLAFLDHHLKAGNSLVGSDISEVLSDDTEENGGQLTLTQAFARARQQTLEHVMDLMEDLLAIDNEDLADIKSMEEIYDEIRADPLYQRLFEIANVHTAEEFGLDVPEGVYEEMAGAIDDDGEWAEIQCRDWFVSAQTMAEEESFFHWELEYPEVFFGADGERLDGAGFDAVVGNPPYVTFRDTPDSDRDYYRSAFQTFEMKGDVYVLFTEKASTLLRRNGYTGYIIQNKFMRAGYGSSLRESIANNETLLQIIDLHDSPVFDISAYPLIITRKKSPPENEHRVEWKDIRVNTSQEIESELSDFNPDRYLDQADLKEGFWHTFAGQDAFEVETIELDTLCDQIGKGAVSGDTSVYLVTDEEIEKYSLERDYVIKVLRGGDVDRFNISSDELSNLIYPYNTASGSPELVDESEIPNIISYLGNHRESLEQRKNYGERLIDQGYEWYELTYEAPGMLNEKIVFPDISPENRFAYDEDGEFACLDTVYYAVREQDQMGYHSEFLTAILNSTLLNSIFSNLSPQVRGGYLRYKTQYVEQLPIPKIDIEKSRSEIKASDGYLEDFDGEKISVNKLCAREKHDALVACSRRIQNLTTQHNNLNLSLLDHLGSYSDGPTLADVGLTQPPKGSADSILKETTEQKPNLRVGEATVIRESDTTVEIRLTARYKPDDEDAYETDQWGYTETKPLPALRITDLTAMEADLIEAFVPVAVDEAGGFAGFRETATKTNSLVDRLRKLTLPAVEEVRDGLESYVQTTERAAELEEKIDRTDELIDEIVYELYGLTDEEIEIVEEAVGE
ncbi:Eco57I restriction-modification methylase domain-containing protein [Halomicroarcula sp. GCM10025324]|uniref:Eco57I restriction-modification methylase domain-containing protein n=1 Tax=Halomicroarcula sp. GCM10025324 TaxID=3252667 RepID=UPI00360A456A